MKFIYIYILFFFASIVLNASNTVSDTDIDYANKQLVLCSYSDRLLFNVDTIAVINVDSNGSFKCEFDIIQTRECFIDLGAIKGLIYIEPNKNYSINLPEYKYLSQADKFNPYFKQQMVLLSQNNPPAGDINIKISEFEDAFDNEWQRIAYIKTTPDIIEGSINRLDSLFSDYSNKYFDDYCRYRYALLVNLYQQKAPNLAIQSFLLNADIDYYNVAFWDCFDVLLTNFRSYKVLKSNKALYELVLLNRALQDDKNLVQLDSISVEKNIAIANIIKRDKSKVVVGKKADIGVLKNINGENIDFYELNFRKVYIVFANSLVKESASDLLYVSKMLDEHIDKCLFMVVFADESLETTLKTCKNFKYKEFVFNTADNKGLKEAFDVKNYPSYFVLDRDLKFLEVPAPKPELFNYYE